MKNKTVLITGATSGIGKITAIELAKRGAHVVFVARNPKKAADTQVEIAGQSGNPNVEFLLGDLALMADVRKVAAEANAKLPRLDVLINNAGLWMGHRVLTAEGNETVFAVNHLAPFLLTHLLLPKLKMSTPARVINLTSVGHRLAWLRWDNLQSERFFNATLAYGNAKLASILFTYEMARRLADTGVTVNCVHPGPVATNFAQENGGWLGLGMKAVKPFLLTPARGAETTIFLATSPDVESITGKYWTGKKPAKTSGISYKKDVQEKMWQVTEKLVGLPEQSSASV
jgi:NAD(P)-dependent dehydrogenase (short-subunit alcohol dehydrogenase family)